MMQNPPMMVEQLQCTTRSWMNQLNFMNNLYIVTIIGQIEPWGIFQNMTYMLH